MCNTLPVHRGCASPGLQPQGVNSVALGGRGVAVLLPKVQGGVAVCGVAGGVLLHPGQELAQGSRTVRPSLKEQA